MNDLATHAEEYLSIRRALGYKLEGEGRLLAGFIAFASAAGAATVSTELAVEWTNQTNGATPMYLARRMRVVRSFARYLATLDPMTVVPPVDLFPNQNHRPTPHVYSDQEIRALMREASTLTPSLRASTHETLIGLLAATGIRIGEAMALDRSDVDWSHGCLHVRESKFNKSRLVLCHDTTLAALKA